MQGPNQRCIAHGGGKRCEEPGCTKSGQGKTNRCFAHGGGQTCEVLGCPKSARGATKRCYQHGKSPFPPGYKPGDPVVMPSGTL